VGLSIALWSITSALAGFLFGFDTVVISGAEKDIQTLSNALLSGLGASAWRWMIGVAVVSSLANGMRQPASVS
jgi:hypothetical protein